MEAFAAFMRRFLEMMGVDGGEVGEDGVFGLAVGDGEACFELSPDGRSIVMYAALGPLPAGREDAVGQELLKANLLFRETEGATIGATESGEVLLQRSMPFVVAETDFERFVENVADFFAQTEKWSAFLVNAGEPSSNGEDKGGGPARGMRKA